MRKIAIWGVLAAQWMLGQSNPIMTGPKVDLSFAQHTRPWALSATPLTLPTTGCLQGEVQYVISVNMLYVASPSCIWLPLVGGSGGSSAFSALTPGTNTNSGSFVFGTSTHLSASGTGTIAATTVAGFTPGAGLLTGPTAPLTLTPGGIGGIWSGCSSGSPLMSYTGNCVAGGGGGGGGSYIASATTSPMLVTAATHGQGINAVAFCFDGTVSGSTTSGSQVECGATKDISGNITITWGGSSVGSIQIFSSGAGPAGPSGNSPAPYITNATTAPQTILASTHGQGANPIVACWSGAVSGTHVTGSYVVCPYEQNPAGAPGDLIVSYTSGDVGSIWVGSAGSGGAGLGDPGAAGLVYRTGLDVTRPGVYGDIFTLFTGCSGSDYPGFDGACHAAVGSGTVTSITVTVPSILNVSPATITTSGTFALSLTTQSAATFFAGPVTGSAAAPAFRAFAATDLAGLTLTNSTTGNAATSTTANSLVAQAADTVVMNATGGSASPSAVAMPTGSTNGCAGTSNALIYNTNTHSWGCNTISGGGGGIGTTGTITVNALTTMADSTHIQTPSTQTTLDAYGDIASGGWISFLHGWWCAQSTDINGGGTPIAGGANSFGIICPTSIPNAYRWKVPSADAAGVLMSDGLGGTTPYVGTLSISSAPIISAANMTSFPTLNQNTTGNATTATRLNATPSVCLVGQAPVGVDNQGNALFCQPIAGASLPLTPATIGAGTVSTSGTSVTGSSSNFTALFPLCSPTCSHSEAMAIYPSTVSPSGYITMTPISGTPINAGVVGSLVWGADGSTFSINPGDCITPTRVYSSYSGVASSKRECWSSIQTVSGGNKFQTITPAYPAVGSYYPYPYIISDGSGNAYLYMNVPPNASNGQTVTVSSSLLPSVTGSYTVTDSTGGGGGGGNVINAASIVLQANNPNSLAAGAYFSDDMTMAIGGSDIGGSSCSPSTLAKCSLSVVVTTAPAWSGSVAYTFGSLVSQSGVTYYCGNPNTGVSPPNASYWVVASASNLATATFAYPHGLTGFDQARQGDMIHISGLSALNVTSTQVLMVGSEQWPNTLTFATSASAGTYAAQAGTISVPYTITPHPVWQPVSSVTNATAATLSSSVGTIASGAAYYSAPDNVASVSALFSSGNDTTISVAGKYFFNNSPSNTGNSDGSIRVVGYHNGFRSTPGADFILVHPEYAGFLFPCNNGGVGWTLDGWTLDAMYQLVTVVPGYGAVTLGVSCADKPSILNVTSNRSVGNFIDIENTIAPRVEGFHVSNAALGSCIVLAAVTIPVVSDGQCVNTNGGTDVYMSSNYNDQNMRGAVLTNITEVNAGSGFWGSGPGILASNYFIEGGGSMHVDASNATLSNPVSDVRLSNFQIMNANSNQPANNNAGIVNIITPQTGVYLDSFTIRGGRGPAFKMCCSASPNSLTTLSNSYVYGSSSVGIWGSSGSNMNLDVSNVRMDSLGSVGVFWQGSDHSLVADQLKIKNANQAYAANVAFPALYPGTVFVSTSISDVKNMRVIDDQSTATGYLVQVGNGLTDGITGTISDAAHQLSITGGVRGQTYVKNTPYLDSVTLASTIQPVSSLFAMAGGATTVNTMTVPTGMQQGDRFCVLPQSTGFSTSAGSGSGSFIKASTAIVGQMLCWTLVGNQFAPSY